MKVLESVKAYIDRDTTAEYRLESEEKNGDNHFSLFCQITNKRNGEGDFSRVRDICVNYRRAKEILDLLVKNRVTPCTLEDVIIDLIC